MTRKTWITRLFAVALLAVAGGQVQAGLLPYSVTITPEAGNYQWTYAVKLPTLMELQSGDYFTIYDFNNLKTGSASWDSSSGPAGGGNWTATVQNVGITPTGLKPGDNSNIENITFTYTGPTLDGGLGLGNFSAVTTSVNGLQQQTTDFTGYSHRTPDAGGGIDQNITQTFAPVGSSSVTPPGVPEPTTLALAGLGLPFVGLTRLVRRKLSK